MVGKRGQVTLFIIIGIVILIAIGTIIYIRQDTSEIPEIIVDPEMEPVQEYVEFCLTQAGKTALGSIGMKSGFGEIPPEIDTNPRAYLKYDEKGILKIPYWHYDGRSNVPRISEIQDTISDEAKDSVLFCLKDFKPLLEKYDINTRGDLEIDTIINDNDVTFIATYPIDVELRGDNKKARLDKYISSLDVSFRKIYGLATEMMQAELTDSFFENLTIDLMAINPEIPFSGLEFDCRPKVWLINDIKNEIQDMLWYNLPNIRVFNTDYQEFQEDQRIYELYRGISQEDVARRYLDKEDQELIFGDYKKSNNFPSEPLPEDSYEYFQMFWQFTVEDYSDLKVSYKYLPQWDMKLISRPSDGQKMSSNMGQGNKEFLSFICVNSYHFTYDIEYPLLVNILDDTAYGGEGYMFRFAFPVMIDHNEPNRNRPRTIVNEDEPIFQDSCTNLQGDFLIEALGDHEGYVNWPLPDVNITYDCVKFVCDLGKTGPQGERLLTGLPSNCQKGFLTVEKPGYLKTTQQVGFSDLIQIKMPKLVKLNVTVKKHSLDSPENSYSFGRDDELLIVAENKLLEQKSYTTINYTELGKKEIELVYDETEYRINLMLVDSEENFYGGYNFNWSYTKEDIRDKKEITFHVLEEIPKPDLDSMDSMSLYEAFESYRIFQEINNPAHMVYLKPEFS
jgi:hypothetical protein